MLSRVADSIYWMNRYTERAENVARFVDVTLYLSLDLPGAFAEQWEPLVATTGDTDLFRARYAEPTRENVIRFLAADVDYPNSILSCLRAARENARSVREVISSEMWQQANSAYLMVCDATETGSFLDAPHDFFTAVKNACHLFVGMTYVTMTHNEGWHFGRLGRLIERADKTSRLLDVKSFLLLPDASYVGTTYDEIQWAALLKSASAFEMYRKQYGRLTPACVLEFLMLEPTFPRSILHCVQDAERSLQHITGSSVHGTPHGQPEKLAAALRSELEATPVSRMIERGMHDYLEDFQERLNSVGDAVYHAFFAMVPEGDGAT